MAVLADWHNMKSPRALHADWQWVTAWSWWVHAYWHKEWPSRARDDWHTTWSDPEKYIQIGEQIDPEGYILLTHEVTQDMLIGEPIDPEGLVSLLVFWAQSTTKDYIRAKTNFNLSPVYSAHKSSNHKFPKTTKSVLTQIYLKQNIRKRQTQNFRRISPFGITPVKKAHKTMTG